MKFDAMIVLDMQKGVFDGKMYNEEKLLLSIQKLIHECRENQVPVVYIRHNGGKGNELEAGTDGWNIHEAIAPLANEKIIEKHYNSAFRHTELMDYLDQLSAKNIIMCGIQTEFCFDVTCKIAFEYEYNVTIGKGTTSTCDCDLASGKDLSEYYEEQIWNNRYARVIPYEQLLKEIREKK